MFSSFGHNPSADSLLTGYFRPQPLLLLLLYDAYEPSHGHRFLLHYAFGLIQQHLSTLYLKWR
jgi:hypothetical protein